MTDVRADAEVVGDGRPPAEHHAVADDRRAGDARLAAERQVRPTLTLWPICTWLSILVPSPTVVSAMVPRSMQAVGADLDVVADHHRPERVDPDVGVLLLARVMAPVARASSTVPGGRRHEGEAVGADHCARLGDEAVADPDPRPDPHPVQQQRVLADRRVLGDRDVAEDARPRPDPHPRDR